MQAFCQIFLRDFAIIFALRFEEKFTEIFAVWRELVVLQSWQDFLELEEESFAGEVAVGEHVEVN